MQQKHYNRSECLPDAVAHSMQGLLIRCDILQDRVC
jgi:hypothetical protein